MNIIEEISECLGGYEAAGRVCKVSGKAVSKWAKRGRLPRTEWTGETDYASLLLAALKKQGHGRRFRKSDLRPSVRRAEAA